MTGKALWRGVVTSLFCATASVSWGQQAETPKVPDNFKGVIELDVRDSTPDWGPYTPKVAPEGAPNILFILYDDTGLGAMPESW